MSVSRIAEKAGVSNATVSRVLNNSKPVSASVAEQVRRAMAELQLQPSQIRRRRSARIESRQTLAIVGLGQTTRGWFDSGIMATMVGELTHAGQEISSGVLLAEITDANDIPTVLRRPDIAGALVFISRGADSSIARTLAAELPVVRVMGSEIGPLDVDQVCVDNGAVGDAACQYLLSHQVDQLAFLTFSPDWGMAQVRARGFLAAVPLDRPLPTCYLWTQNEFPFRPEFYGCNPIIRNQVEDLIAHMVASRKGRIGLFVPRDEETVHVYRLLAQFGLRPVEDVLVVSCDNEDVRLNMLHPRPASIDLCPADIASRAVRRLATRIKFKDESPVRILVKPRLVSTEPEASIDASPWNR